MNYGHRLEFGTFITPRSATVDEVVALAKRSEELGYDLVTFQDHPYQPALLDAWTLLAWVAGQTERIRIAANVLNVPLREPAVLGRAAASLDRLSGGRLELALGAGAYWDAIAAMGGRKLGPGEAVAAFEEAIDVVRGMLDTGESSRLRVEGDFYRVSGAQRGPVPAHEIPIWVGAVKPRMLRLIGPASERRLCRSTVRQVLPLCERNIRYHDDVRISLEDKRPVGTGHVPEFPGPDEERDKNADPMGEPARL